MKTTIEGPAIRLWVFQVDRCTGPERTYGPRDTQECNVSAATNLPVTLAWSSAARIDASTDARGQVLLNFRDVTLDDIRALDTSQVTLSLGGVAIPFEVRARAIEDAARADPTSRVNRDATVAANSASATASASSTAPPPPQHSATNDVTIKAPTVTVTLLSAGKGPRAPLRLSAKTGLKQDLRVVLDTDVRVETAASNVGDHAKCDVNVTTEVLAVNDDLIKVRFTVDSIVQDGRPSLATRVLPVTGAIVEGELTTTGIPRDFVVQSSSTSANEMDLNLLGTAISTWPIFPTEAVGVGAKWRVVMRIPIDDHVALIETSEYTLSARNSSSWTITASSDAVQDTTGPIRSDDRYVWPLNGPGIRAIGGTSLFPAMTSDRSFVVSTMESGGKVVAKMRFVAFKGDPDAIRKSFAEDDRRQSAERAKEERRAAQVEAAERKKNGPLWNVYWKCYGNVNVVTLGERSNEQGNAIRAKSANAALKTFCKESCSGFDTGTDDPRLPECVRNCMAMIGPTTDHMRERCMKVTVEKAE